MHAGGEDLKFPHHDNELAQSEAFFGHQQWVNYFFHAGHLQIKGLKMSKSLKNFVTIAECLERWTPRQLRMLFLMQPWDGSFTYSDQYMEEARDKDKRVQDFLGIVADLQRRDWLGAAVGSPTPEQRALTEAVSKAKTEFHLALLSNFDTPRALAAVMSVVDAFHAYNAAVTGPGQAGPAALPCASAARFVADSLAVFGVEYEASGGGDAGGDRVPPLLDALVAFRERVRAAAVASKNTELLKACDELRDGGLTDAGVVLEDRSSQGLPALWKLRNPAELRAEFAAKKEKEERDRVEKLARKREVIRVKLDKAEKELEKLVSAVASKGKASFPAPEFSEWDADGIPTKDAAGQALSGNKRKELAKEAKKVGEMYAAAVKGAEEQGVSLDAWLDKKRADVSAIRAEYDGVGSASAPGGGGGKPAAASAAAAATTTTSFMVGAESFPTSVASLIGKSFASVEAFVQHMKAASSS